MNKKNRADICAESINQKPELAYQLQIRLKKSDTFFGPGVAALLSKIDETGSIHAASAAMYMSYNKAWHMIVKMEKELKTSIVIRKVGGANGGSSKLSSEGKAFLAAFFQFEKEMNQAGDELFEQFFLLWTKALSYGEKNIKRS